MKKARFFVLSTLLSVGLSGQSGQSGLTGGCRNSGTYPHCDGGEVVFTGSNYPSQVHITVTNSSGKVIDDGDYTTSGGTLSFAENLSFADTYTVSVNNQAILTVTTT
jgi:hypothetical protein